MAEARIVAAILPAHLWQTRALTFAILGRHAIN